MKEEMRNLQFIYEILHLNAGAAQAAVQPDVQLLDRRQLPRRQDELRSADRPQRLQRARLLVLLDHVTQKVSGN